MANKFAPGVLSSRLELVQALLGGRLDPGRVLIYSLDFEIDKFYRGRDAILVLF